MSQIIWLIKCNIPVKLRLQTVGPRRQAVARRWRDPRALRHCLDVSDVVETQKDEYTETALLNTKAPEELVWHEPLA